MRVGERRIHTRDRHTLPIRAKLGRCEHLASELQVSGLVDRGALIPHAGEIQYENDYKKRSTEPLRSKEHALSNDVHLGFIAPGSQLRDSGPMRYG
jgi:hypothetical protein